MSDWILAVHERLLATRTPRGAWGYRADSPGSAEPTAMAALALHAHRADAHASDARSANMPQIHESTVREALNWLIGLQKPDGSIGIASDTAAPHWPTALALLALTHCGGAEAPKSWRSAADAATRWLLAARGNAVEDDSGFAAHDTTLSGWFWVENTHSWIEPTSYAILALRAVGQSAHARVREGVKLILDRALDDGGWNYGNRRVLENALRPFPATTGVALTALAGEPRDARIEAAIAYLLKTLPTVRAPLSLTWGLMGLRAWAAAPDESEAWLVQTAERTLSDANNPWYYALLLLAATPRPALLSGAGAANG